MTGSKSIKLQSKLLTHLFGLGTLAKPQSCYFQIYTDELNPNPQGNHELSLLTKVGTPVQILSWSISEGYINPSSKVVPATVSNSSRIILPQPEVGSTWSVSHWGIWRGLPDTTDSLLLYWQSLDNILTLTSGVSNVYSFAPGELIITEK